MKAKTMASALAAIFLAGLARAGSEGTNQPPQELRLELDLADGSHIIGTPSVDSVPVETPYAKMKLPFSQIVVRRGDPGHLPWPKVEGMQVR